MAPEAAPCRLHLDSRALAIGYRHGSDTLLVLLDLAFIIFESANLALAFESMAGVDGSCDALPQGRQKAACSKSKSLVAVLLFALIAWLFTFTISMFRLVERINP